MVPRSSCRAPIFRSPAIPTSNILLFGDRAVVEPLLDGPAAAQGQVETRAHRGVDPHGRQAEPGAALRALEVVDVAGDRRGEEGRGRCRGLGRQYRRLDGDGALQSQDDRGHRAAGDRRALADAQGRVGGARRRRLDRRRRAASGQSRRHGQRHGARAVRHRAADRGPAQYRGRGGQGPRAGARGRPHPARRPFPAFRLSRLRRRRRHRQGRGRRGRDRGLCRQYRAQDRRRHRPPVRAISAQAP